MSDVLCIFESNELSEENVCAKVTVKKICIVCDENGKFALKAKTH